MSRTHHVWVVFFPQHMISKKMHFFIWTECINCSPCWKDFLMQFLRNTVMTTNRRISRLYILVAFVCHFSTAHFFFSRDSAEMIRFQLLATAFMLMTQNGDKQHNEQLSNLNSFPLQTAPFSFAQFVGFSFSRNSNYMWMCVRKRGEHGFFFKQPICSDLREYLIFFVAQLFHVCI